MRTSTSLRRTLTAAAFAVLAMLMPLPPAHAAEYTDLWVTPGEDAWGVNFVQWDSLIYATFFIYGPDKKPTWYGAVMSRDGSGNFAGTLYTNQGTYFALPWNPADIAGPPAGTASFRPSTTNNYQGTLIYTVNGVGTMTKAIQRYSDYPLISLAGSYSGGESDAFTNCNKSSDNNPTYLDFYTLQIAQSGNTISLNYSYPFYDPAITCTLSGVLTQNGLLYGFAAGTYLCSDGTSTTAALSDLKLTAQGIEGHFSAASVAGGCHEESRFSAARY